MCVYNMWLSVVFVAEIADSDSIDRGNGWNDNCLVDWDNDKVERIVNVVANVGECIGDLVSPLVECTRSRFGELVHYSCYQ